jgi:hypothetical protein
MPPRRPTRVTRAQALEIAMRCVTDALVLVAEYQVRQPAGSAQQWMDALPANESALLRSYDQLLREQTRRLAPPDDETA